MSELQLSPEDADFLLAQTGFQDVASLKSHILKVQSKAAEVFPYPCIRRFDFIRNYISNLPCYETFICLAKERNDAIFLDIGCCCECRALYQYPGDGTLRSGGTDIRKVVADGVLVKNVVGTDLRPGRFKLEHHLKFLSELKSITYIRILGRRSPTIQDLSRVLPRPFRRRGCTRPLVRFSMRPHL